MYLNLLNQIGKQYPQAVYLPVRTLYLTLRIEQRGKHKRAVVDSAGGGTQGTPTSGAGATPTSGAGTPSSGEWAPTLKKRAVNFWDIYCIINKYCRMYCELLE